MYLAILAWSFKNPIWCIIHKIFEKNSCSLGQEESRLSLLVDPFPGCPDVLKLQDNVLCTVKQ